MRKPLVLVIVSVIFLAMLLTDFLFWEGRRDVDKRLPAGRISSDFVAQASILGLAFDDRTKSVIATLEVRVEPGEKKVEIRKVSYGYQLDADGTSNLLSCTREIKECFTSFEDVPRPNGPHVMTAKVRHTQVSILLTQNRPEIWYPFDRFSFPIDFRGWVNQDAEGDPNLGFERLVINDSEPNFILREESDRYLLVRRPFIRIVSVAFLVLSLAFFVYLIRLGSPKDLLVQSLGFFGALWGLRSLLLPATVNVFPTVVDYVILTEFCLLFMVIISKVSLSPEDKTTK
jgi:hypothetical protein